MLKQQYNQKDHTKRIISKIALLRKDIFVHSLELECIADYHKIQKLLDELKNIILYNYSPE